MNTDISKSVRTVSGTQRKSPSEFQEKVGRFFERERYNPSKVAEAIVRAVEKNKSVVPVGLETHLVDVADRLSRRFVDFVLRSTARFGDRWA